MVRLEARSRDLAQARDLALQRRAAEQLAAVSRRVTESEARNDELSRAVQMGQSRIADLDAAVSARDATIRNLRQRTENGD